MVGSPPLQQSTKTLTGPSNNSLPVQGRFKATLAKGTDKGGKGGIEQVIYVVDGLSKCLLGQPAIEALGLVSRVQNITGGAQSKVTQNPIEPLFEGLGKLEGPYTIVLEENAQPHAISTHRRVPIPLMPAVQEELSCMEKQGVTTRVHQPTDWCAGMVVVLKKNGKVRICVDLTKLNKSVKRERHPMPAVEQTLAQLAGAKVFSKLDANSGFWQIPLSAESALLTTFMTPFGRFCFNRLPFGISSASEHFQRRMSELLEGLEGVAGSVDDFLIHGKTQEEHDQRLHQVLLRLQKAGLKRNVNFQSTEWGS